LINRISAEDLNRAHRWVIGRDLVTTPEYHRGYLAALRVWGKDSEFRKVIDEKAALDTERYARRRESARRAYRSGAEAPPPTRHSNPPPRVHDNFSMTKTFSDDDARLCEGSRRLLRWLAGRWEVRESGEITTYNSSLATRMGKCPRTIQRYRKELRKFGYILEGRDARKRLIIQVNPLVIHAQKGKPFARPTPESVWATFWSSVKGPIKKKGKSTAEVIHSGAQVIHKLVRRLRQRGSPDDLSENWPPPSSR
jgi:hypothetical protein